MNKKQIPPHIEKKIAMHLLRKRARRIRLQERFDLNVRAVQAAVKHRFDVAERVKKNRAVYQLGVRARRIAKLLGQ